MVLPLSDKLLGLRAQSFVHSVHFGIVLTYFQALSWGFVSKEVEDFSHFASTHFHAWRVPQSTDRTGDSRQNITRDEKQSADVTD